MSAITVQHNKYSLAESTRRINDWEEVMIGARELRVVGHCAGSNDIFLCHIRILLVRGDIFPR
jgi:hypothetical protein